MEADFEVFAEDGNVFAEIEARGEFGEGGLALGDFGDGCGCEEPGGEGVFADAGAGEGEELEEAAVAEEVEVRGVEAGLGVDAIAGLADAGPVVFDAGQAVAVEGDGALGAGAAAEDVGVEDGDDDKYQRCEEEPPGGEGVAIERKPGGNEGCDDDEEAQVSEADVLLFKVGDLGFAGLLTGFVLFGRRRAGGRHVGIIAYC